MLVLSRKKDESVVINNDIRIVVVEIRGDKVRLGVEAPKEVPVHRSEVYEAINHGGTEGERTPRLVRAEQHESRIESEVAGLADGGQLVSDDATAPTQPDAIHD